MTSECLAGTDCKLTARGLQGRGWIPMRHLYSRAAPDSNRSPRSEPSPQPPGSKGMDVGKLETAADSPTDPNSPATLDSPPSTANPARPSTERPEAGEATTDSRRLRSSPPSHHCDHPNRNGSTTANEPNARNTTQASSAWPAAAATSSRPWPATTSPTGSQPPTSSGLDNLGLHTLAGRASRLCARGVAMNIALRETQR